MLGKQKEDRKSEIRSSCVFLLSHSLVLTGGGIGERPLSAVCRYSQDKIMYAEMSSAESIRNLTGINQLTFASLR